MLSCTSIKNKAKYKIDKNDITFQPDFLKQSIHRDICIYVCITSSQIFVFSNISLKMEYIYLRTKKYFIIIKL